MSEWDLDKKKAFTKAMGKKRANFAKGGLIKKLGKRKYFDDGGSVYALGGPANSAVGGQATNPNTGILGSINGALGLNDNYQAGSANLQAGTNAAQLNQAYTDAQNGIANQANLVNTLQPQAQTAVNNQNDLANQYSQMTRGEGPNPALAQLNQATGKNVANQAALMAGQRGASANAGLLARQTAQQGAATQQEAAGQGATLQAQQQIAAQNNLANLANNQISQTGQAVTGQNSAAQNEQANLQNANTSLNNANVGMQSNINNVNSQTAAANQNMAGKMLGGIGSAVSGLAGGLFAEGGEVEKDHHIKLAEMNSAALNHAMKNFDEGGEVDAPNLGTFKAGVDSASSPSVASSSSLPSGGGSGGGGGGAGLIDKALGAIGLADGGQIQANPLLSPQAGSPAQRSFAQPQFSQVSASSGPSIGSTQSLPTNENDFSKKVDELTKKKDSGNPAVYNQSDDQANEMYLDADSALGGNNPEMQLSASNDFPQMVARGGKICEGPHQSHVANFLAHGGKVKAMVSAEEVYLSPDKVRQVIHEGANPIKIGYKIPGKAKVKNDSLKNDVVPMTLEEGGVVIPRHITTHKMAPEKAELFVHRAIARKKASRK